MTAFEYCKNILSSPMLCEKLKPYNVSLEEAFDGSDRTPFVVRNPARSEAIAFSEEQIKFPKAGSLGDKRQRGKALHFFANHELLAIEMMAQAVCQFPEMPESMVKSLIGTITDEQKHFNLYLERMKDFDVSFGDYPLNAFFWSYMEKIETYQGFFAVMSLTFEQANLDFCKHYEEVFKKVGDEKTANLLKLVYDDEIKHVARGYTVLKKKNADDLWCYYRELLPAPLTPARAKGMIFDTEGRVKAGLELSFIKDLQAYQSDFKVTKRKSWKT